MAPLALIHALRGVVGRELGGRFLLPNTKIVVNRARGESTVRNDAFGAYVGLKATQCKR